MMKKFDVIVIGAGPSGSTTANLLSRSGFNVILIEKKKVVGVPIQCGEATTLNCFKRFDIPLQEDIIKNTVKGCKIILPKHNYFYSSAPWVNIRRDVFDQYIVDQAINNGCKLETKTKMIDLKFKQGYWKVFTTKDTYLARFIIGADGSLSKTADKLGFHQKKGNFIKGFQYKFQAKDVTFSDDDWLNLFMDPALHGGYKWVFPRGDEYNIGVGGLSITISHLDQFCSSLGINPRNKIRLNGGLLPFNFTFKKRSEKQSCVVGDAAGMVNPSTGAGIHAGMVSGFIAAKHIIKSLEMDDHNLIKNYNGEIKKTPFLHPTHQKTAEYLLKWTIDDWSILGESFYGKDIADLSLIRSFLLGIKNPTLFLKSKELLAIRKSMRLNRLYS